MNVTECVHPTAESLGAILRELPDGTWSQQGAHIGATRYDPEFITQVIVFLPENEADEESAWPREHTRTVMVHPNTWHDFGRALARYGRAGGDVRLDEDGNLAQVRFVDAHSSITILAPHEARS